MFSIVRSDGVGRFLCTLYLKTAEVASEINLEFADSLGSFVGKVCSDSIELHTLVVGLGFFWWWFFLYIIERKQKPMT